MQAGQSARDRSRPLAAWSADTLRLVLGLTLEPREITGVFDGRHTDPADWRQGAVLRKLILRVRRNPRASRRLEALLARRLWRDARPYAARSFVHLARVWAEQRERLPGASLAALLWTVARNPDPVFRSLECRLVEEIELRAVRVLASAPAGTAVPGVQRLACAGIP